jgi:hypothetical protein
LPIYSLTTVSGDDHRLDNIQQLEGSGHDNDGEKFDRYVFDIPQALVAHEQYTKHAQYHMKQQRPKIKRQLLNRQFCLVKKY